MAVPKDFFLVVMVLYCLYYMVIFGLATAFALYVVIQLGGLWILMFIPIMLVGLIVIIVRKKSADTQIGNLAGNANTTRTETIMPFTFPGPKMFCASQFFFASSKI